MPHIFKVFNCGLFHLPHGWQWTRNYSGTLNKLIENDREYVVNIKVLTDRLMETKDNRSTADLRHHPSPFWGLNK